MASGSGYFRDLTTRCGRGWTRFWFAPSDPTTLGLIRLLTAAMALAMYLVYLPDLELLFGPAGLLSRQAALQFRGSVGIFSIFDYASTSATLWIFYWAGAVAIALMLVGLCSRVTTVLALVAFLSIIHRGAILGRPVDDILAMLMFYLCLGPNGQAFSLDALIRRARANRATVLPSGAATVVTRLIQIHLAAIYLAMVASKLRGTINTCVWWDGTAVWDLIARPEYPLVDLTWLGDNSDFLWYLVNAWTLAILAFEFCFPILIWNRLARPLLLGVSILVWIGTAILTGMVSFAVMMLVASLAFVPGTFVRGVFGRRLPEAELAPAEISNEPRSK
jgi:hypothetical protein